MTATHLLPKLTRHHYADAVTSLMKFAIKDCGGSKTCAMVLLNTYDYTAFNFDITDLCFLDENLYSSALVVIRCRKELGEEPHLFIDNGERDFEFLCRQWKRYAIKKGARS